MITENGVVTHADPAAAWIKTIRYGACEHCKDKDNCGSSHEQKEMTIQVENTLDVKKGDHVIVGIRTRPMIYLTFLLYVFPIICLIIGAVIGNAIAPSFGLNQSLTSMFSGFSCFALAFYFIRKKHGTMSQNDAYKPFLVRKKSGVIPSGCSTP